MGRLSILPLLVAVCVIAPASSQPTPAPAGGYEPIPAGYDFPSDERMQLRFRDTQDVVAMRRHAWMVFAGATQPARGGEAVWETWIPSRTAFGGGCASQSPGVPNRPAPEFQAIRQLQLAGLPQPQAPGASLFSTIMFNLPGCEHIRSGRLFSRARLDQINNGFPANTPVERRTIQDFPRDAVSLKLVWTSVSATEPTPMRVWDGIGMPANANPQTAWPRTILVDPTRTDIPADETRDITVGGLPIRNVHVVPVGRFYSFRITATQLASIRRFSPQAAVGDYALLLAMHVTTKEIPEWVWATFWWHDRPDEGMFAAQRPDAVRGAWRNYLMDVTYSMETPLEYDATPNAIFNPYLESFPQGMVSNCMTCHQDAVWTPNGPFDMEINRGPRNPNDPLFRTGTKLDFLWSVALESR